PPPSPPSPLSLHDALPILIWLKPPPMPRRSASCLRPATLVPSTTTFAGVMVSRRTSAYSGLFSHVPGGPNDWPSSVSWQSWFGRSEEHTSELQSREKLVCR